MCSQRKMKKYKRTWIIALSFLFTSFYIMASDPTPGDHHPDYTTASDPIPGDHHPEAPATVEVRGPDDAIRDVRQMQSQRPVPQRRPERQVIHNSGDIPVPGSEDANGEGEQTAGESQGWHSSSFASDCEKLTQSGDWSQYANIGDPIAIWKFETNNQQQEGEAADGTTAVPDEGAPAGDNNGAQKYVKCHAFMLATDPSQYQRGSDQDSGQTFESFSGSGSRCQALATEEEQKKCFEEVGQEGASQCRHMGHETQDYIACKQLLQTGDGFFAGKSVLQSGQILRENAASTDANARLQQAAASGNDLTGTALQEQSNALGRREEDANTNAGFNGAKAAAIMSKVNGYPTKEKLIAKCAQNFSQAAYDAIIQATGGDPANSSFDAQMTCAEVIDENNNNNYLLMNQNIRDEMEAVATEAAMEGIGELAKALALASMGKQVDDTIEEIEKFEPPEFTTVEPQKISVCLADPTAEGCPQLAPATLQGFGEQQFNASVGNRGAAENLGGVDLTDNEAVDGTAANTDRDLLPDTFGTGTPARSRATGLISAAPAGSSKPGTPAAAGGGGGGGGGSASPPGRAPAADKENAPKPSGITSSDLKTVGSGGGVIGGRGRVGAARPKKNNNPFAKLIGKKKPKNKVLNFRKLASLPKGKRSVLEMISTRYGAIRPDKKRIMQYKKEDK